MSELPRRFICHHECPCGGMGIFVNSCSNVFGHDGPHNHGPRLDCPWIGLPKEPPQHRLAVLD